MIRVSLPIEQVPVHVRRDRRRRVPQLAADEHRIQTLRDQQRREHVPMHASATAAAPPIQARRPHRRHQATPDDVPVMRRPADPSRTRSPPGARTQRPPGARAGSTPSAGIRTTSRREADVFPSTSTRERSSWPRTCTRPSREVHVLPAQPQQLTLTQPREHRRRQDRPVPLGRPIQQPPDLRRLQDEHLPALDPRPLARSSFAPGSLRSSRGGGNDSTATARRASSDRPGCQLPRPRPIRPTPVAQVIDQTGDVVLGDRRDLASTEPRRCAPAETSRCPCPRADVRLTRAAGSAISASV